MKGRDLTRRRNGWRLSFFFFFLEEDFFTSYFPPCQEYW
jgi:hypothetical protein